MKRHKEKNATNHLFVLEDKCTTEEISKNLKNKKDLKDKIAFSQMKHDFEM